MDSISALLLATWALLAGAALFFITRAPQPQRKGRQPSPIELFGQALDAATVLASSACFLDPVVFLA